MSKLIASMTKLLEAADHISIAPSHYGDPAIAFRKAAQFCESTGHHGSGSIAHAFFF